MAKTMMFQTISPNSISLVGGHVTVAWQAQVAFENGNQGQVDGTTTVINGSPDIVTDMFNAATAMAISTWPSNFDSSSFVGTNTIWLVDPNSYELSSHQITQ